MFAAIDDDPVARDVTGKVRAKIGDSRGDFLGPADALGRDILEQEIGHFIVRDAHLFLEIVVHVVSPDPAGSERTYIHGA